MRGPREGSVLPADFAERVKSLRHRSGLSQEGLATALGVSFASVNRWENGQSRPSVLAWQRIVRAEVEGADLLRDNPDGAAIPAVDSLPASTREAMASGSGLGPALLPLPFTSFIGRERELAAIAGLLDPGTGGSAQRLLTLSGPPGAGKTRLALQIAAQLNNRFANGASFVPLAPIADPDLVVSAIAGVLAVPDAGTVPLIESLKLFIQRKEMLVVLDNFEHVMTAAPVVTELLGACSRLTILVTSRMLLHVAGECDYPVPPLDLPERERLGSPTILSENESVRLFLDRARAVLPGFALGDENVVAAAEICTRLDGLPLAIELAAARIRLMSPQALLTRLAGAVPVSPLRLLASGARDLPARQQTLRGAIAWSYDLLGPAEQQLFRRLSVFAGGCTLEAAEAVGGDGSDILDGITSLLDNNLLRQEQPPDREPRLVSLETIREYGLERLIASGEEEAVRRRHAQFYLELAEEAEAELRGSRQLQYLAALEQEHYNLRAALRWAIERRENGLRLANALWWFWYVSGHLVEGSRWLDEALAAEPDAAGPERAKGLSGAACFAWRLDDREQAAAYCSEALALIAQRGGNLPTAAIALHLQAVVARDQGDLAQAGALHDQSLRLYRDLEDRWGMSLALAHLGILAQLSGDDQRAVELYEEALALGRAAGDRWNTAYILDLFGLVEEMRGDLMRASAQYRDGLALQQELGERTGIGLGLIRLAGVATAQKHLERAARLFGISDAIVEALVATWPTFYRNYYDLRLAELREGLDAQTFAALWAEGHTMPIDEGIAYALGPEETRQVSDAAGPAESKPAAPPPQYPGRLTPREVEVLRLTAGGLSNRQIAAELRLSVHTVERHIATIYRKLDLHGKANITAYALRHGLAQPGLGAPR